MERQPARSISALRSADPIEAAIDTAIEGSFPASDPPPWTPPGGSDSPSWEQPSYGAAIEFSGVPERADRKHA
jgi:hypothetical protein